MSYASQANLERALGSPATLVELLDKDGDGIADAALISEVLDRADAEINSAIQIAIELPLTTVPPAIIYYAADIGAYLAYGFGSGGLAMPQNIQSRYEDALRWLDDVANRKRTVGVAAKPATDLMVEQVERNPTSAPNVTWQSLQGVFW